MAEICGTADTCVHGIGDQLALLDCMLLPHLTNIRLNVQPSWYLYKAQAQIMHALQSAHKQSQGAQAIASK